MVDAAAVRSALAGDVAKARIGGRQALARALFAGLGFHGEALADGRWVGKAGEVAVELEGDPLARASLLLPMKAGAGVIASQFLGQFARGTGDQVWLSHVLDGLGETMLRDRTAAAMDLHRDAGGLRVRAQTALEVLVVTVTRVPA